MKKTESDQIYIARVFCITLMFYVHVNPGLSNASLVSTGNLSWLGEVLADFLGRASVAALSFFSGYIMIGAIKRGSVMKYSGRRIGRLIVPMLCWNFLYIIFKEINSFWSGGFEVNFDLLRIVHWLSTGATGLLGPTENLSLFFLRDLFVSGVITFCLARVILRFPILILSALTFVTIFFSTNPIIFRPTILLFMTAGLAASLHGLSIERLSSNRIVIPAVLALSILHYFLGGYDCIYAVSACGNFFENARENILNIIKRSELVFLVLIVSRWIAGTAISEKFLMLEKGIFTCYLSHVIFISMLWVVWKKFVGDEFDVKYSAFFLMAPFYALALGQILDRILRRFPRLLQISLRGRVDDIGLKDKSEIKLRLWPR